MEDTGILCRVVDYIHLNPVRAGVVAPAHVGGYPWSSLQVLGGKKSVRLAGLTASEWLEARGGWKNTPKGVTEYVKYLAGIGNSETAQRQAGLENLSRGWALGTYGWKKALAREYAQGAPMRNTGMERDEVEEIRDAHNENTFGQALAKAGKTEGELPTRPRAQAWKIKMALEMRDAGVPVNWLARRLHLGRASSVRSLLSRARNNDS